MGSTNITRMGSRVKERIRRLNTQSPYLNKKEKVNESTAMKILSPLSKTIVSSEDMKFALSILEQVYQTNKSRASTIATYIANELAIGLDSKVNGIDLTTYDIGQKNINIITSGIEEACICQRIINNQNMLSKRFDLDGIVSSAKDIKESIYEMCGLIDTYDIPDSYKYSVALENICYTLSKNSCPIESDAAVISAITEYFLTRDGEIPDDTYKDYQEVLGQFYAYNESSSSSMVKIFMESDGDYFRHESAAILNKLNDDTVNHYLDPYKVVNEATAIAYMENVSALIETINSEEAEAALLYTAKNVSNYHPIDKDIVCFQRSQLFGDIEFDKITSIDITIDPREPVHEKPGIFDKEGYKKLVEMSADEELNDMIARFKTEQKKDTPLLKRFINKLYAKHPKDVINELPSIMSCIRLVLYIVVASLGPVGVVASCLTGLVNWFISAKINEKQSEKLLDYIRKETKTIEAKIKRSEGKEKSELEEYKRTLNRAERKVIDYLQSISNDHEDQTVGGSIDDLDLDDMNFESSVMHVDAILQLAENCLDVASEAASFRYLILKSIQQNCLHELSELVYHSSYSFHEYKQELYHMKNEPDFTPRQVTAIIAEEGKLTIDESFGEVRNLFAEVMSNQILKKELNDTRIVQEKVNLNAFKLAIQNGKAKLKDLSMKEKSLWQTVDAHASGLARSIEKAMTSDRREAIIKGNIIPKFSKLIKGSITLAGIGVIFGPTNAAIAAVGALGVSGALNAREKKLLMDEIDTELKVVEKQLEIAQNDGDMNQYRFLLNYQKKLTREYQRIRYGLKVTGRNIPSATLPGRGGHD